MTFKVSSITTKLLLLFMLVGLASVAVVGIYSFYAAREAIIKRTMDQLISVRAVKKQQIEYFFAEKSRNLEFLARSNDMKLLAGEQSSLGEIARKAVPAKKAAGGESSLPVKNKDRLALANAGGTCAFTRAAMVFLTSS